jgi:transcriptional regulator with XRE-family HTH domain
MDLGKSIKIALIKKGVLHKQMAEDLGISPQQVSLWIRRGRLSQDNLRSVASYFQMPVSQFIALGEDQ